MVHCYDPSDGLTSDIPIIEALVLNRLERLGEKNYVYDFTDCLDYPLEEYAFSLSSIAARLDGMENEIDEDETEDPYADAFIDREYPVIDGEFSDDDESLN